MNTIILAAKGGMSTGGHSNRIQYSLPKDKKGFNQQTSTKQTSTDSQQGNTGNQQTVTSTSTQYPGFGSMMLGSFMGSAMGNAMFGGIGAGAFTPLLFFIVIIFIIRKLFRR